MPHVHVFSIGVYITPFVKQVVYAFHIQIYVRLIYLVRENEVFHIEIYVTVLKYNGEISVLCENMTFFPFHIQTYDFVALYQEYNCTFNTLQSWNLNFKMFSS